MICSFEARLQEATALPHCAIASNGSSITTMMPHLWHVSMSCETNCVNSTCYYMLLICVLVLYSCRDPFAGGVPLGRDFSVAEDLFPGSICFWYAPAGVEATLQDEPSLRRGRSSPKTATACSWSLCFTYRQLYTCCLSAEGHDLQSI